MTGVSDLHMETLSMRAEGLCVSFGKRAVLHRLSWSLPKRGLHALMGSGGAGKSTLLAAICDFQALAARTQVSGEVLRGGEVGWVAQRLPIFHGTAQQWMMNGHEARAQQTITQQRQWLCAYFEAQGCEHFCHRFDIPWMDLETWERRLLSMLKASLNTPALLCVDEPTRGLDPQASERLMAWLARAAKQRAVLLITHHQAQVKAWCDTTALLGGGQIQVHLPTPAFFDPDAPPIAVHFVRTGGCSLPCPSSTPDELDPSFGGKDPSAAKHAAPELPTTLQQPRAAAMEQPRDTATKQPRSPSMGPRGFRWVQEGALAGTPQPGIFEEVDTDLQALKRVGIHVLVTLTESRRYEEALLASGIQCLWFPIRDMGAPSLQDTATLLAALDTHLQQNKAVAFHCHAGLGRTGTMLAAALIWRGAKANDAIETVRAAEPRYIQSNVQLQFLMNFEFYLRNHPPTASGTLASP